MQVKHLSYTETMKLNKIQIHSLNLSALQKESFMSFCISFAVFFTSLFLKTPVWEQYRFYAVFLASVSLAIFLLCVFDKQQMLQLSTAVAFTYSCFLLFYFSVFHFFSEAQIPAICFYCLLILMPIIFFTKPFILYPILATFTAFYICFSYVSEDPFFTITTINSITAYFFSFILSIQLQKTKLQTIETGRIIEAQRDTDLLTGLPNRTKLINELEQFSFEEDNSIRGVFMIDIDLFKKFNDTYGHYAGDKCLKAVGSCLSEFSRQSHVEFFRYGGEEFIGIARSAALFDYQQIAQDLVVAVHDLKIPCCSNIDPYVTISAGYATQNETKTLTIEDLISRADWALYKSKSKGRNQQNAWQETPLALSQIKKPEHTLTTDSSRSTKTQLSLAFLEHKKIPQLLKTNTEIAAGINIRLMVIIFSMLAIIGNTLLIISSVSKNTLWKPYRMPYAYLLAVSIFSLAISLFFLPKHKKYVFSTLRILVFLLLPFIFYERFFTNSGATDYPFLFFCLVYTTVFIDSRTFCNSSLFILSVIFSVLRIYYFGFDGIALFSIIFTLFISIIAGDASCYTKLSLLENNKIEKMQRDTDILTGLPNRRKLFEELSKPDEITAVYMADIDFFKQYNDKNGHQCGDDCLRKIGEALTSASLLTGIDFFRYGGEEFTGIVRSRNMHGYSVSLNSFKYDENALVILNEIRSLNIHFCPVLSPCVTLSCGYAINSENEKLSPERLIELADKALYCAKENGRNQAVKYQN